MEEAIKIVENKLAVVESMINSLPNVDSFLARKYILQDVLKELKSAKNK